MWTILKSLGCAFAVSLVIFVCPLALQADQVSGADAEQAREIIAATGVRGGLVVHLGCGDGGLTAALRVNDSYLVQGLDADRGDVARARERVRSLGLYGPVSVDVWSGEVLAYADNLVNLLVAEDLAGLPMSEVMRVLVPEGVAYVKADGRWTKTVKPRPEAMDEWTHHLHDPGNNAVAHDTLVGPPARMQWVSEPARARHHEHSHTVGTMALVSSGGRLFMIQDEGPAVSIFLPPKWSLTARDAMNGILLWKRPLEANVPLLSIAQPGALPQMLVAVGEHVYVALGLGEPVSDLDAATGRTLRVFEKTQGAEQIVCRDGRLFVAARPSGGQTRLVAFEAGTGRLLWEKSGQDTAGLLRLTLAVDGPRVVFQTTEGVVCLDVTDGTRRWVYPRPEVDRARSPGQTLVARDGVVLLADRAVDATPASPTCELIALEGETGDRLWSRPCGEGWRSPVDVLVVDGLVWFGMKHRRGWGKPGGEADLCEGVDLRTGDVKKRLDTRLAYVDRPHHHRCYREKATDRYLLIGRHGVEMVPLDGGKTMLHDWIRGGCGYGVMPANGLLYLVPHPCKCHAGRLLTGFRALASEPSTGDSESGFRTEDGALLELGPAYGRVAAPEAGAQDPKSGDWPTYRHNPARSSCTNASVDPDLSELWHVQVGDMLTSVVVAEGKLLVADVLTHTVYALDAETGTPLWNYTAGGRVDSPPTIYEGLALFGSADGWVYCLRAEDGELVWRLRAAPRERRVVANEQLESTWPVHGNVLVRDNGVGHVVAGRSEHLDGGMLLYDFDVRTGRVLKKTWLDGGSPGQAGVTDQPDILSSNGQSLHMRLKEYPIASTDDGASAQAASGRKHLPHLIFPTGMLDGSWWHRTHWVFGTIRNVGGNLLTAGLRAPAGQIMAHDDEAIYGYGRKPGYFMWTSPVEYRLFATDRPPEILPMEPPPEPKPVPAFLSAPKRYFRTRWSFDVPLHVRAMVLASDTVFVAGPPNVAPEGPPERFSRRNRLTPAQAKAALAAWEGRSGALLWAVSAADGTKLAERKLESPPVFDGMAAVSGRLYMSTVYGKVTCFGVAE